MTLRRKPKRLAGDNPLLRRAFEREEDLPAFELERRYNVIQYQVNLNHAYRAWLREHGIDPDTGKMTPAGLKFFEQLVADQNTANRTKRAHRADGGRPPSPGKPDSTGLPDAGR